MHSCKYPSQSVTYYKLTLNSRNSHDVCTLFPTLNNGTASCSFGPQAHLFIMELFKGHLASCKKVEHFAHSTVWQTRNWLFSLDRYQVLLRHMISLEVLPRNPSKWAFVPLSWCQAVFPASVIWRKTYKPAGNKRHGNPNRTRWVAGLSPAAGTWGDAGPDSPAWVAARPAPWGQRPCLCPPRTACTARGPASGRSAKAAAPSVSTREESSPNRFRRRPNLKFPETGPH